jgi:formylglycine-generating enzyme required for sulfatase activity
MRLPALILAATLAGCGADSPAVVPPYTGPEMLWIEGADVAHGAIIRHVEIPREGLPPAPEDMPPPAPGEAGRPMTYGTPPPLPMRSVRVSGFWIDATEVTREAYRAFLLDTGYRPPFVDEEWALHHWNWSGTDYPPGTGDHPVVMASWHDARAYCAWAGKRLPTEAEWQLAVLGPAQDEWAYPWGQTYQHGLANNGQAREPNFDDSDGWLYTSPVGAFPRGASRSGVLDGFGNAWEWIADLRVKSWDQVQGGDHDGVLTDPHTGTLGNYAVNRGGSYFFDISLIPWGERSAGLTETRRKTTGFRCARSGSSDDASG